MRQETKNLTAEQKILVAPRRNDLTVEYQKGAILEFQFWLKNQGRAKNTYEPYGYSLEFLLANGANLFDPKSVNDLLYLGKLADKKGGRKYNLRKAYVAFMHTYIIQGKIDKPKINRCTNTFSWHRSTLAAHQNT
jgi:hypothetical protein